MRSSIIDNMVLREHQQGMKLLFQLSPPPDQSGLANSSQRDIDADANITHALGRAACFSLRRLSERASPIEGKNAMRSARSLGSVRYRSSFFS